MRSELLLRLRSSPNPRFLQLLLQYCRSSLLSTPCSSPYVQTSCSRQPFRKAPLPERGTQVLEHPKLPQEDGHRDVVSRPRHPISPTSDPRTTRGNRPPRPSR